MVDRRKHPFRAIDIVDPDGNIVWSETETFTDDASLAERSLHLRVDMGLKPEYKMKRVDLAKKQAGSRQLQNMKIGGTC